MKFPNMPKLSERLKYIRTLYNLSQVELAERAGTTQQAIQQAEKGKARQPRYLHQLANNLEISVEWIVFGQAQDEARDDGEAGGVLGGVKQQGLNEKSSEVLDSFLRCQKKTSS